MSEILGHDVNGRPLRAGDRAVLVNAENPDFKADIGRIFTVRHVCPGHSCSVCCDETLRDGTPPGRYGMVTDDLRRIDDRADHQPCGESFAEMMDRIKRREGVPA